MTRFVLRRLLASIPVVVASSIIVFALVASGDPLSELRSKPNIRPETIEFRSRQLRLDRSVPARYALWAGGLLRGDLGRSVNGESVSSLLARAAPLTASLVVAAVLLGFLGALLLGSASALRRHSSFDRAGTFVAFVLLSLPVFWLSGVLKDAATPLNRALGRTVFYVSGARSPVGTPGFLASVADRAGHLALPALTLALILTGEWSRYLRFSMVDELETDYVRAARARGLSEPSVARHVLRSSLVPLAPVASLTVARLIGGAVVTETVFDWHGMGSVLIAGLRDNDVNVVMGWLLLAATAVIACNLLADIAGAWLDPRVRRV